MWDAIQFEWPWAFVLLPLPLLVYRLLPAAREHREAALKVPYLNDFALGQGEHKQSRKRLPAWLYAMGWLALVAATARPQYVGEPIELPVSGRDLMMAIDLSGSMKTRDFIIKGNVVDRLTATKYVASDFIERRVGDRIGLILFGEQAYLQAPLTFDRKTVKTLLLESAIGLAGKATAIGDAIGLALKRLLESEKNHPDKRAEKVLILLTDGESNAGSIGPIQAAELAAKENMKIYTIGIGGARGMSSFGLGLMRGVNSDLDEATLKAIAQKTGGEYFRAHNVKELERIYQILDQLEPVERDTKSYRPTRALYMWPLAFALLAATLISILRLRE